MQKYPLYKKCYSYLCNTANSYLASINAFELKPDMRFATGNDAKRSTRYKLSVVEIYV